MVGKDGRLHPGNPPIIPQISTLHSHPSVATANGVWKKFETTLKARLKHTTTKEKWWANKVWSGDFSQDYANEVTTRMQAEAAEVRAVLIDWTAPKSIGIDTKEATEKECF